jgi:hypothetical protein
MAAGCDGEDEESSNAMRDGSWSLVMPAKKCGFPPAFTPAKEE